MSPERGVGSSTILRLKLAVKARLSDQSDAQHIRRTGERHEKQTKTRCA